MPKYALRSLLAVEACYAAPLIYKPFTMSQIAYGVTLYFSSKEMARIFKNYISQDGAKLDFIDNFTIDTIVDDVVNNKVVYCYEVHLLIKQKLFQSGIRANTILEYLETHFSGLPTGFFVSHQHFEIIKSVKNVMFLPFSSKEMMEQPLSELLAYKSSQHSQMSEVLSGLLPTPTIQFSNDTCRSTYWCIAITPANYNRDSACNLLALKNTLIALAAQWDKKHLLRVSIIGFPYGLGVRVYDELTLHSLLSDSKLTQEFEAQKESISPNFTMPKFLGSYGLLSNLFSMTPSSVKSDYPAAESSHQFEPVLTPAKSPASSSRDSTLSDDPEVRMIFNS